MYFVLFENSTTDFKLICEPNNENRCQKARGVMNSSKHARERAHSRHKRCFINEKLWICTS